MEMVKPVPKPSSESEDLEEKEKEITELRNQCIEVEEMWKGKANQLEMVVAEKEAALQVKIKEEQDMLLKSKELKEELNLANEQVEEAKNLKETLAELELASTLKRDEMERHWGSKLEEKDKEAFTFSKNVERLDSEVQRLRIELESKSVNEEQKVALDEAEHEVETLKKHLEQSEKQRQDLKASLEAEVAAEHEAFLNEQERLRVTEDRAHFAERELASSKKQLQAVEEKCRSLEVKLDSVLAEFEQQRSESVVDETVEAKMAELRSQLKAEREEWKTEEEKLHQKLKKGDLEREGHLRELEAAVVKVDNLEGSQGQLIKEKERLEGLLSEAEVNLNEVRASEKEATLRFEEGLRSQTADDEIAAALRAEVADLKLKQEESKAEFEGEVERLMEEGKILEHKLADLQSKLEAASLQESDLIETVSALQTQLSGKDKQKEQADELQSNLAEEQAKVVVLKQNLQEEQSKLEVLKSSLEEKEGELEAANMREADNTETIDSLQKNINEANLRVTSLTENVAQLQNYLAESRSKETNRVEAIEALQTELHECKTKEASLAETVDTLNNNLVEVSSKEANLTEAMTSLKSINEMVTKAARESEARYRQVLEEQGRLVEDKARVEAMLSKVEGEKVQIDSLLVAEHEKVANLRHELDQLMSSKEARATEEKDVDEAEVTMDKNMMQVLNEKSREVSQLKAEVGHLVENLNREREEKENMSRELEESKLTHSAMNAETVKKLSMLIRDKDLEIESLGERNKSLLEIIDNEKESENMIKLHDGEKQKLLKEIEVLKESNSKVKADVENSNELIRLKDKILELERKLQKDSRGSEFEIDQHLARHEGAGIPEISPNHNEDEEGGRVEDQAADLDSNSARSVHMRLETRELQVGSLEERVAGLSQELEEVRLQLEAASEEVRKAREEAEAVRGREAEKEQEVERLKRSCVNLQSRMDEREHKGGVDQQEVQAERARLAGELAAAEGEKEQALGQARARLKEAQDLRKEVSSVIEKKRRVEGEVERLRGHLVSVEEGYTTELVEAEEREAGLRKRVASLEDQLRVASVSSTEATQSASQASSQLNKALEAAASQRDKLQVGSNRTLWDR